ncbi:MAG: succinate dehydrogenase, hydrophobic membrane anchor protein [Micrococcales bacterium]
MSVVIEQPKSPRSRKAANWEKYGWMYMRFSGVILLILIFGHLYVNLLDPAHEGIKSIDFAFVAGKGASPFWKIWDGLMLWLALIHGTNGMRTLVNDYAEKAAVRKTLQVILLVTCVALIILGTFTLTTFDPCLDPNAHSYLPQVCK